MPAKQTRRSVSVKGITHQRIKNYVDPRKESVASFVEMVIAERLGEPTDEDRRKFGEAVEQREKESVAAQTAQKDSNELQEAPPLPDPPAPDELREAPVEAAPAPEPVVEPQSEPAVVAKPKLPREAAPAPAAPEPDKPKRTFGGPIRKLSKGSPAPDLKRSDEPEEPTEGFEDYIPPILQF